MSSPQPAYRAGLMAVPAGYTATVRPGAAGDGQERKGQTRRGPVYWEPAKTMVNLGRADLSQRSPLPARAPPAAGAQAQADHEGSDHAKGRLSYCHCTAPPRSATAMCGRRRAASASPHLSRRWPPEQRSCRGARALTPQRACCPGAMPATRGVGAHITSSQPNSCAAAALHGKRGLGWPGLQQRRVDRAHPCRCPTPSGSSPRQRRPCQQRRPAPARTAAQGGSLQAALGTPAAGRQACRAGSGRLLQQAQPAGALGGRRRRRAARTTSRMPTAAPESWAMM